MPLWNPYEGLGISIIGNLNSEIFNPLKIFLNFYPNEYLQDVFYILRLLVMGIFTYLFLKKLNLSDLPALFGASFFMLSGYSIWWINLHPLSTVMYFPAVFYFYEKWRKQKDTRSGFLASLFFAFALFAGKTPEVIMGTLILVPYALWKSFIERSSEEFLKESFKLIIVIFSGVLISCIVILPFIELYIHASPIAKAIRTGASSHTLPLISSITFIQPLFLSLKNYFYSSWIYLIQGIILPHSSMVVTIFFIYSFLDKNVFRNFAPFSFFVIVFLLIIFGIIPSNIISHIPIIRSIEFLKYNAMLYFSIAVISAAAFDKLLSENQGNNKFNLSIFILSSILIIYFFSIYKACPLQNKRYLLIVLSCVILVLFVLFLFLNLFRNKKAFGYTIFILLLLELFLYMPKEHPERIQPYKENTLIKMVNNRSINRIIGDGNSLPPLVSNAFALFDIRAISVLLPGDYYTFFQNLVSFSIPYTNNPDQLFSATSPFIDLLGVKYILSKEKIDTAKIEQKIKLHLNYLKWIRLFNSMIEHSIEGSANYGFIERDNARRFCLFFSRDFVFRTKVKISEPFITGFFIMKEPASNMKGKVRVSIDNKSTELELDSQKWAEIWLNVSDYLGKTVNIKITGIGSSEIAMGDFGLSPGMEKENELKNKLLALHKNEINSIELKGIYNNAYVYENKNVMDRAFMLYKTIKADSLNDVINKLQDGFNFRDTAIVDVSGLNFSNSGGQGTPEEKVQILKYTPCEINLKVETRGGLLVLSDLYYPGWKVKVNGKQAEIIKTFGVLRGVVLKPGKNNVIFYYRPLSFYTGLFISISTVIIWLSYLIKKRNKKNCIE